MGRSVARALLLVFLGAALPALLRASQDPDPQQQQVADDDPGHGTLATTRSSAVLPPRSARAAVAAEGRCAAGDDDKDCGPPGPPSGPSDSLSATPDGVQEVESGPRRINNYLHGRPLVPDEGEFGFLYARSVSLSLDDDAPRDPGHRRTLKNRVFGQSWCSASTCPLSATLTLANGTSKTFAKKIGQGEAVVACLDCTFSAVSVSILDGAVVCAVAASTNMPRGVCTGLCWLDSAVDSRNCSCEGGCSSNELGSESVHSYDYRVVADTSIRDLLSYLHRLMVRLHNAGEHLNIASVLDVSTKTRNIRRNVERRFGKDKAKAVPLLHYDTWGGIS